MRGEDADDHCHDNRATNNLVPLYCKVVIVPSEDWEVLGQANVQIDVYNEEDNRSIDIGDNEEQEGS